MQNFTRTDSCSSPAKVDQLVRRLVSEAVTEVEKIDRNVRVRLTNVSIASQINDAVAVCCFFDVRGL